MRKCILKNYKITCHTKGHYNPKNEKLQQRLHLGTVFDISISLFPPPLFEQIDTFHSNLLLSDSS